MCKCLSRLISIPLLDIHSFSTRLCWHTQPFSRLNPMVRKLTFGRVFSRSRDTDRPPAHLHNSPTLPPISINLPLSKGSKFKEEAASAIFTATVPAESITGSARPYPSPKLQKRPHGVTTTASPTHPSCQTGARSLTSTALARLTFQTNASGVLITRAFTLAILTSLMVLTGFFRLIKKRSHHVICLMEVQNRGCYSAVDHYVLITFVI
ncbi:hypothetical protein C8R48DRAFT_741929 [Suillus tomentosus]|nr:hypothetical protein C8R48DRAFT_741929 [Suillus tomentosus]